MNEEETEKLRVKLVSLGEKEVARRLAMNAFNDQREAYVRHWLSEQSGAIEAAAAERKEAREVETLEIARKALRNSERATMVAIIAIALSTVMAIQKIIDWYSIKP